MKSTQIRAEVGRRAEPDVRESRPCGSASETAANIDDVLRQIIREDLAARFEE
jgi:hypothetical protein